MRLKASVYEIPYVAVLQQAAQVAYTAGGSLPVTNHLPRVDASRVQNVSLQACTSATWLSVCRMNAGAYALGELERRLCALGCPCPSASLNSSYIYIYRVKMPELCGIVITRTCSNRPVTKCFQLKINADPARYRIKE